MLALALVLVVALSIDKYNEPAPAAPEALAHIAQKNRNAAIDAAARMRVQSAVSTNAAESLANARMNRAAQADAASAAASGNRGNARQD
jgi:hypothetical protein